jgi:hypothetical protein
LPPRLTTRLTRLARGSVLPARGRCASTMPFGFLDLTRLMCPMRQCAAAIRRRAIESDLPFTAGT